MAGLGKTRPGYASKGGRRKRDHPRLPDVSRQSGGTSGDLSIPWTTKTPVSTTPYRVDEPKSTVQKQVLHEKHLLHPLEAAILDAYRSGVKPDYTSIRRTYGRKASDLAEKAFIQHLAGEEGLGEPEDLTNAILVATGLGGAVRAAGTLLSRAGARAAIEEAGAQAASAGAKDAGESGVKAILKQAAAKAEPEAVQAARQTAKAAAEKVPQGVRTAAKTAARAGAYPIKHPIQAPFALALPQGAVHGDPLAAFKGAAEGKGAYADVLDTVSGAIGGIPGEAVSLPAAVLPSAYLAGKAGLSAAKGDPKELDALIKEWKETGVLPALAEGDLGEAAEHLTEHPLYGLLEGSGAANVLGRGAGALSRELTGGRVGGVERPSLPIKGTDIIIPRRYSRDLLRQAAQRGFDRTRAGREVRADTFRGRRKLKEAANRFGSGEEAIRREHAREDLQQLKKILPKKGLTRRLDRASADVVNFAVERLIQNPNTFFDDLPMYKEMIEAAAKERLPNGKPALDREQLRANRQLLKQIDKGLKRGNPEHVVEAANHFIDLQGPILDELVNLNILTPDQAAKASATSFARVHMGAGHSDEHGVVDSGGKPLSLKQIEEEMTRRGVAAPGFLSHRPPTPGDYYRPSLGGAIMDKGIRTGESVAKGVQLGGIESLVRQLRRSRGLVDRAKAWNRAVTRFGVEVKGVETMADAKRVLRDPERYGIDPSIAPVAVPRHPFASKKEEIEGALEHQDPSIAGDISGELLHNALNDALADQPRIPDDAKVIFMPQKVAEEFRDDAAPSGAGLKTMQAATTAFKRAVLPFSPGFYIGNGFDNVLRTALAGINPAHFIIGEKVRRSLTKEQRAELLSGAHFSSVEALAPHRSVENVVRGYDPVSKSIRAAAEWGREHGWKQATVKFAPKLLSQGSRYLMAVNALLTEDLPQRGALGKVAAAELHATQGSWVKALRNLGKIGEDFAKGATDPDKMIRFQKQLEEIYGNYTRMSPAARKVLSTVAPFWTWMRSAYKFVYLTMPAHHSIATGFLAASANATREEREQYGLDKEGEKPLPNYLQGSIPLPDGGVFPTANFNSFGYASDPLGAIEKAPFPQIRNVVEDLAGRDWKGDPIEGGEGDRIAAALWDFATAYVPGANLLGEEVEGQKEFSPHINLPHPYDEGYVQYKRKPTETITVPTGGGGESSGGIWGDSGGTTEGLWGGSPTSSGGGIWR